MSEFQLSSHASDMLTERDIAEEWVRRTVDEPDQTTRSDDGNLHYAKGIRERSGRMLHVVVNANVRPMRVITVFFDRRLSRKARKATTDR